MKTTCAFVVFGLVAATSACSDSRDTRAEREARMADTYPSSQPAQNTPPPQIPTEPQTPDDQQGTLSNGRGGSPNPSSVPPT